MKWLYYQRNAMGHWAIQGSDQRPDLRGAEGKRYKIKQITELPDAHRALPLGQLEKLYPFISE